MIYEKLQGPILVERRLDSLHGWRGVAILLVFIRHYFLTSNVHLSELAGPTSVCCLLLPLPLHGSLRADSATRVTISRARNFRMDRRDLEHRPIDRISAPSMTFCISRMLPGQEQRNGQSERRRFCLPVRTPPAPTPDTGKYSGFHHDEKFTVSPKLFS
jgi:hypothetical protein